MSHGVRSEQAGLRFTSMSQGLNSLSKTMSKPNTSKQLFRCSYVAWTDLSVRQTRSLIFGSMCSLHEKSFGMSSRECARMNSSNCWLDITISSASAAFLFIVKLLKCLFTSSSLVRSNGELQIFKYADEKTQTSSGSQLLTSTH